MELESELESESESELELESELEWGLESNLERIEIKSKQNWNLIGPNGGPQMWTGTPKLVNVRIDGSIMRPVSIRALQDRPTNCGSAL